MDGAVYQIYVRSFYDSDGDGCGDLRGIIEKLPYIASLGVRYIWLTPFFPSPQRDNGYDVSDYLGVDPAFGSMGDFEELAASAKKSGVGLILDMVFNHTSTEHPWFKKAIAGDARYRDYYFFREGKPDGSPPCNWESKFGGPAWEKLPGGGEYYLHLYSEGQADLNWRNPDVRRELGDILRFWMKKGAEGFRFDVINVIAKPEVFEDDTYGDGRRFYTDGPEMESYLKEINRTISGANEGAAPLLLVGELSSTSPEKCVRYCRRGAGELSMVFHFHHLKADYPGGEKWVPGGADISLLHDLMHGWQTVMCENDAWDALFWNNHDQPRAIGRFASDKKEFHYHSATMLAATMHFMRGTPYIYMGEEIGMTDPGFAAISDYRDVETLNFHDILRKNGSTEEEAMAVIKRRSRDNGRVPMQWTDGPNAGFTDGTPWINAASNRSWINVKSEESKKDGVLSFYKHLIALRKEVEVIQNGDYKPFLRDAGSVFAFLRENESHYLMCVNNYSDKIITLPKSRFDSFAEMNPEVLASNYGVPGVDFNHGVELRPYETLAVLLRK
ncbi:MAG: alpha,alpha-phosphotrehalase [Synergistaceae bacterium]|jgi:trehalose-6-phosphate hydrolase|nr:alpha,alpha-phosphotrehalase [Synergistaceae bacterium]